MKYYICELTTHIDDYEINSSIRFETDGDPDDYATSLAHEFWGDLDEELDGVCYYKGSDVMCWVDFVKEVPKEVYDALAGIITKLGINSESLPLQEELLFDDMV